MSVRDAAIAVASAMGNPKYVVVGDAACVLLGSTRAIQDVYLVVPKGKTPNAQEKLRIAPGFIVQPRTNHTTYGSVEIEILAPPALFQSAFDDSTPTVTVGTVHILKPALILDAKCQSIADRPTGAKEEIDAADIEFLLTYIARHGIKVSHAEVPAATEAFVRAFIERYGRPELWRNAGYDESKGSF